MGFLTFDRLRLGGKRWQAFGALCGLIRTRLLGNPAGPPHEPVSWPSLIETAKDHCAMPALSWCVRSDASVPPELRSYLDAVHRLNGKRNERLCDTLEQVVRAFNAVDIEPMLLKGAAHLVLGLYPSPAARLLGDLDVLIPEQKGREAIAALERIGFYVDEEANPRSLHHLPGMRHVESDFVIEMHIRLVNAAFDAIVPVEWVCERSRPVEFRGLRVRTPDATALIAHNVVHDQLHHHQYLHKQLELRQLLDLALIRARYERDIEWAELERKFANRGRGRVLATYLCYDERLLGQPMPALNATPRPLAVARLRGATEFPLVGRLERKLHLLATSPREDVAAVFRDPRRLARQFNPRKW